MGAPVVYLVASTLGVDPSVRNHGEVFVENSNASANASSTKVSIFDLLAEGRRDCGIRSCLGHGENPWETRHAHGRCSKMLRSPYEGIVLRRLPVMRSITICRQRTLLL